MYYMYNQNNKRARNVDNRRATTTVHNEAFLSYQTMDFQFFTCQGKTRFYFWLFAKISIAQPRSSYMEQKQLCTYIICFTCLAFNLRQTKKPAKIDY